MLFCGKEPAIDRQQINLAEAAQRGDLESFGELCGMYYKPMTAMAFAILADHHLAEDAVQEAYARALVKLPDLKKAATFAAWLARICRNVALDVAKSGTQRMYRSNNPEALSPMSGKSQDRNGELNHVLKHALERLPNAGRELLVLRYYHDMSCREIAALTGLTLASVNTRLQRTRDKLGRILRKDKNLDGCL